MTPISDYSEQALEEELKRRKEVKANPPNFIPEPNFDGVIKLCKSYMQEISSKGYADSDYREYIFEVAMCAVYGENAFDWINQVTR